MCGLAALCHGATLRLPGLQPAIEHGNRVVAHPLEHPPQPAAVRRAVAVIGDGLHAVGKAHAGQPDGKALSAGQRVASARGGDVCRLRCDDGAIRSGYAMAGAQRRVEVCVHRARDMGFKVLLFTQGGVDQVKAAVKNHQRLAAVNQV